MPRVKRSVHARKKRRKVLEQATPGLEKFAKERVERLSMRSVEGLVEALASIREGA